MGHGHFGHDAGGAPLPRAVPLDGTRNPRPPPKAGQGHVRLTNTGGAAPGRSSGAAAGKGHHLHPLARHLHGTVALGKEGESPRLPRNRCEAWRMRGVPASSGRPLPPTETSPWGNVGPHRLLLEQEGVHAGFVVERRDRSRWCPAPAGAAGRLALCGGVQGPFVNHPGERQLTTWRHPVAEGV